MPPDARDRSPVVVFIDDNPGDALLFSEYLDAEAPGAYDFIHLHSYAELDRLVRQADHPPAVVLIDCAMDAGQGIEYVRRTVAVHPTLAVIGLCEHLSGVWSEACQSAGAIDVIAKDGMSAETFTHAVTYAFVNQARINALFDRANYDPLTGLANRNLLYDRIEHAIERAIRSREYIALLMVDLDDFKQINDGFGHDVGDEFLQAVSGLLCECVRDSDTVARLGGDEFAVLLEGLRHAEMATHIASKLTGIGARSLDLRGTQLRPSLSVGVSLFAPEATRFSPEWLMKAADTALYQAKECGKNQYHVFTEELDQEMVDNLALDREIRLALSRNELVLYFQPILDLKSRSVVAVEALLRWQHPVRGLLDPRHFLPALEKLGYMPDVGKYVLREALHNLRAWRAESDCNIVMHINISASQLAGSGFAECVLEELDRHGIDGSSVCLEMTESVLFDRSSSVTRELDKLRERGVRLSIDDFGTGYGSYNYLQRFEIDNIKIDKSFVDSLGRNNVNQAIIRSIVNLAGELDISVIAEGVENTEQIRQLEGLGIADVQGYLFYRPLPAEQIRELSRAPNYTDYTNDRNGAARRIMRVGA